MATLAPSEIFSQMITATHRHQSKKIVDQFLEHNALYRELMKRGNVHVIVDGGTEITYPIDYAANTSIMNYSHLQELNVSRNDFLTNVKYEWRQKAGYIVASGRELRENKSKPKLISLSKAKRKNFKNSVANHMAVECYQDGSTEGSIGGLASIITPNGKGKVGGIDGDVHSFWRNKVVSEAAGAYAGVGGGGKLRRALDRLKIQCTIGIQKPDLYTLTNDLFEIYQDDMQIRQRFMSEKKAKQGFDSLIGPGGAPIIHDHNVSGGFDVEMGYALNTEFLHLFQHSDAQWKPEAERMPVNQDGVVIPHFYMGNMGCDSRRHQGMLVAA